MASFAKGNRRLTYNNCENRFPTAFLVLDYRKEVLGRKKLDGSSGIGVKAEAIAFEGRIEELMSSICEPKDIRLSLQQYLFSSHITEHSLDPLFHRDICGISRPEIECVCSGP